jgi:hypothetical protein
LLDAPAPEPTPVGLPPIPPVDENLHILHCSSALQCDCTDQTPPVSAIVVEHPWTGRQTTFAAFTIAESSGIHPAEFLTRLPDLERELLQRFFEFAAERPQAVWAHWGMRGAMFGFDALTIRARVLGLEPVEIPPDRRFDLSSYLKLRYGDGYAPHPRLWNVIRSNLGAVPYLLDETAAAAAWHRAEFAALVRSLGVKVASIANLLDRTRRGTFKAVGAAEAVATTGAVAAVPAADCGTRSPELARSGPERGAAASRPTAGGPTPPSRKPAAGRKTPRPPTAPARYQEAVKLWPTFRGEMQEAGRRPTLARFREWLRRRAKPIWLDEEFDSWWRDSYCRRLRRIPR